MKRRCLGCGLLIERGSYCAGCKLGPGWGKGRSRQAQARFRKAVLARDGYRCVYVENKARCPVTTSLRAAHIIALADGGTNEVSNGRTLCRRHDRMTDPKAR